MEKLPYEDIMAFSAHPWDDMKQGRFSALASAELHRLEIYTPLPQPSTEAT